MIWIRVLRWFSLKPFLDKGIDHFCGSTREERHFEFRQYYWNHRLAGCDHRTSLMLARMELRILRMRTERHRLNELSMAHFKRSMRGLDTISRIMSEVEAKREMA